MTDTFYYDMVDLPVDRLFWHSGNNRILAGIYPVEPSGQFIGKMGFPFPHFAGVGTISQWEFKFNDKLLLAPSAREWFIMRRAAWGHQLAHFDTQYAVPDLANQLFIVSAEPRFLVPVDTPVMIEFMHWLRHIYRKQISVINRNRDNDALDLVISNLKRGEFIIFFTGNSNYIFLINYLIKKF
jgi:hypothetical protein